MNKFFLPKKNKLYKNFTLLIIVFVIYILNTYLFPETYKKTNLFICKQDVNIKEIPPILFINFPNPFSSETYIYIKLPQKNSCSVKIYDLFGNLIKKFVLEDNQEYVIVWNGSDEKNSKVASGGYICVLDYLNTRITRKIGYIK
jgi:hypothetical protein